MSRSPLLSCLSRSSTPTCTGLIGQYLFSSLAFEVRAFLSQGVIQFVAYHTRVRGMRIVVTPQLVADVLHVLRVEHPDYLGCERLRTVSKDKMISAFCERPAD